MDISSLNNYFELYGGIAIFIVVLLEYMNLPGFPAGIIMPLAGIYAAHGGDKSVLNDCYFCFSWGSWELDIVFPGNVRWKCFSENILKEASKTQTCD